jgi:hypothetical protein
VRAVVCTYISYLKHLRRSMCEFVASIHFFQLYSQAMYFICNKEEGGVGGGEGGGGGDAIFNC